MKGAPKLFNRSSKSYILEKKTKYFHDLEVFCFYYFTCYLERTNSTVMTTQIKILAMEALLGIQSLLTEDSYKNKYIT